MDVRLKLHMIGRELFTQVYRMIDKKIHEQYSFELDMLENIRRYFEVMWPYGTRKVNEPCELQSISFHKQVLVEHYS